MARRRSSAFAPLAALGALALFGRRDVSAVPGPAPVPPMPTPPGLPFPVLPSAHAPPGAHRILAGETLVTNLWSSVAVKLRVIARVLYDDGSSQDFLMANTTSTGSTRALQSIWSGSDIGDPPGTAPPTARINGWVVSMNGAQVAGTALQRAQLYATVLIATSEGGSNSTRDTVGRGYISALAGAIQLNSNVEPGPAGGQGAMRTVTGTNPAAGLEVSETSPAGTIWKLRSFGVILVTDGTVATRTPRIVIDDGTTANRRAALDGQAQTATQTRTHLWFPYVSVVSVNPVDTDTVLGNGNLATENIGFLQAGVRIRTVTASLQAGDDYAAPIYQVEEWVMPN